MPLPPPIRLVNTGSVGPPDNEGLQDLLLKDYNGEDSADGETLTSPNTIVEEERASKAWAEDTEMVDIGEYEDRLKYAEGRKQQSGGGRKKNVLSSTANCSTTTRKRPGKASRMSLRVDSASLQDRGHIDDTIYGILNIEMDPSCSLLDREDPRDIPSLFRRHDRYYARDAREEQSDLSSRHEARAEDDVDRLPVVLEGYGEDTVVTPLEASDDSNMFPSRYMYYSEVHDVETGEPGELYYAGVDYHSHAASLGDSNRTPAERKERAKFAAEIAALEERVQKHRLQRARERQQVKDRGRAQLRQLEIQAVQRNFERHSQLSDRRQAHTPADARPVVRAPGTIQGQVRTEVGDPQPTEMQAYRYADPKSCEELSKPGLSYRTGQSGHPPGPVQPQAYRGLLSPDSDSHPSAQDLTSGPFATPGTAGVLPIREETGTKRKLHKTQHNPDFQASTGRYKKFKHEHTLAEVWAVFSPLRMYPGIVGLVDLLRHISNV